MENAYQDIKADMEGRISSIRLRMLDMEARLEAMKEELSALETAVRGIAPEEPAAGDISPEEPSAGNNAQEESAVVQIVPEAVSSAEPCTTSAAEPAEETCAEEAFDENCPEPCTGYAAGTDAAAETVADAVHDTLRMSAIKDVYARKEAWRTDMPGAPLDDIWNALSLNDRALFTNSLFREDPELFMETVGILDRMDTLDQAVEYLSREFPEWDMDSDLVYRFMMELRRKLK